MSSRRMPVVARFLIAGTLVLGSAFCPSHVKKNHAPDQPTTPAGPANTRLGDSCCYQATARDPDGDSLRVRFDWGDSTVSNWSLPIPNGGAVSMFHSWSIAGTYPVRAQASDTADALSDWSVSLPVVADSNQPPGEPAPPTGPTTCDAGSRYSFAGMALDPEGDKISYRFSWGDGDTSDWGNWLSSGQEDTASHVWPQIGPYRVIVQAKDTSGAVSSWSDGLWLHVVVDTWTRVLAGTGNDRGWSVQPTSDGGYITTGATDDNTAVWLIKTGAAGDRIWDKTFFGISWAEGRSVQQTSDGGYVITGSEGAAGIWLIRTDPDGNKVWDKTFGAGEGYSVQQTSDGGYVIAGCASGNACLIKTDGNGDQVWNRTFGGGSDDGAYSVQQTRDGGYIITGYTRSYGAGGSDVWLIKADATGNKVWDTTFGGTGDDVGRSVQQTTFYTYIITGSKYTYDAIAHNSIWLIEANDLGSIRWDKTYETTGWFDRYGQSVQQTWDGGYVITGQSFYGSDADVLLIKTGQTGELVWESTLGGSGYDMGASVRAAPGGGYIIAGSTNSFGAGDWDIYLIKTDENGH